MRNVQLTRGGDQVGDAINDTIPTPNHSRLFFGAKNSRGRAMSLWAAMTVFNLLPGTTATGTAGKDDLLVTVGTGTEVVARSTKGGINLKSQSTTPADNDNALLKPITDSSMQVVIGSASRIRFATRVSLTQITEVVVSAGLDENFTTPLPDGTAGDGAAFLFDAGEEVGDALSTAQHANWILTQKVNGADTFIATTIPVLAGVDYELEIEIGPDLKPNYYINGELAGTGVALTSGDTIGALIGLQINAASPAGQKDMDVRYVSVERNIG